MDRDILAEAARQYAGYGWHVVAVKGKAPIGAGWQNRATSDPGEAMAAMLDERVDLDGLGIVLHPSGLVDLDADSPEAEEAIQRLFGGNVPITPTYQSTRGLHRLFAARDWPDDLAALNKWMAGPIEVRGCGPKAAQSVFPPSGGRHWIHSPETVAPAELSDEAAAALVELHRAAKAAKPKPAKPAAVRPLPSMPAIGGRLNVEKWLSRIGIEVLGMERGPDALRFFIPCPGRSLHTGRNRDSDCCVTLADDGRVGGHCFHVSCSMNDGAALRAALGEPTREEWGLAEGDPIPTWVDAFLASPEGQALDAGTPTPANAALTVADTVVESSSDENAAAELAGDLEIDNEPFPESCLRPMGLMGLIVDHIDRVSRFPQPELALAATIGCMATLAGQKVRDESDTRTNIYLLGLERSGAGKEAARKVVRAVLQAANPAFAGPERVASGAGAMTAVHKQSVQLMLLDEAGRLFASMQDARNPHLASLVTVLMQLFTSSDGRWTGDAYSDEAKTKVIDQPCLSIYGTSTPGAFWGGVSTRNVEEGLIGRLCIFTGRGYQAEPRRIRALELPTAITDVCRWWSRWEPGGDDTAGIRANPKVLERTPEAMERYESHEREICKRRMREDDLRAAIWSRAAEKAAKLALIHAASRAMGAEPDRIELCDMSWAIRVNNWCTRRLYEGCDRHVAANQVEADAKRVMDIIRRAGKEGLSGRDACRKMQWLQKRHRDEILATLVNSGMVRVAQGPTTQNGGRPPAKYFANPTSR